MPFHSVRLNILFALFFVAMLPFFLSEDAFAHHIVSHVNVPASPMKMSLTDDFLYVAHMSDRTISVIDTRTDLLFSEITTSGGLIAVEAVPEKNLVYAAVFESDGIDVYEMDSGTYLKTITLPDAELIKTSSGGQPYGQRSMISFLTGGWDLAYNPNTELLYVASYNGDVIRVIDTRVDQVMETIPVADDPYTLEVDPLTGKVIVASLAGNTISIITPSENEEYSTNISHEITSEIKTTSAPWCLDIDSLYHNAFVTNRGASHITVINILEGEEIEKIPLAGRAHCVTVDEDEHRVYASLFTSNDIVKINGENFEIIDVIATESPIWGLIADPNSHKIYASYQNADEIVVLSPESFREYIPVFSRETPVFGIDYIVAHGQDVKVYDAYISAETNSLVATVSTTDGGQLTIQIPRTILTSEVGGEPKRFLVTINGKPAEHEETKVTDEYRFVSMFVPENGHTVIMQGTDILSEPVKDEKTQVEESDLICQGKVFLEDLRGKIACTFPETAKKLVERGWGKYLVTP